MANTVTQNILEIPDRSDSLHLSEAGGDVIAAVSRGFEALLRAIAAMALGGCIAVVRFLYSPTSEDPQSRLRISLTISTSGITPIETAPMLFRLGPTAQFYKTAPGGVDQPRWEGFPFVCEIVRRADLIQSLVQPEFNPRVLPHYYQIHPFEANPHNDYLKIDEILSHVTEEAAIEIRVASIDISQERQTSLTYIARLQSVNRHRHGEDEDTVGGMDYIGNEHVGLGSSSQNLKAFDREDPMADQALHRHRRFHDTLPRPHLQVQACVLAKNEATATILASAVAGCAFRNGSYRLNCHPEGSPRHGALIEALRDGRLIAAGLPPRGGAGQVPSLYKGFERLTNVATVEELLGLFRLPVASRWSPYCIRKTTDPPPASVGRTIRIGFADRGQRDDDTPESARVWQAIPLLNLTKHITITGATGCGKTSLVEDMMIKLGQISSGTNGEASMTPDSETGTYYTCFEGRKREYREVPMLQNHPNEAVRRSVEGIRVYTPGNDEVSPLRLNPLCLPPGISLDNHIESVMSRLEAAQPMPGPLRPITVEAIHEVCGAHPDPWDPPVMSELLPAAERVLLRKGYSSEVYANLRGALDVRLGKFTRGSLGRIFSSQWDSPSIDELIHSRSIIELASLHTEDAAFITLCMLSNVRTAIDAAGSSRNKLRLVIILEEAHRIFGRSSSPVLSEGFADPKGHVSETLVNNMAEVRALGVGFAIIDSMPSHLPPEVHKNTVTKVVFGLTSADDRQELGNHALLNPVQIEELGRMKPGEAFLMTEGYARPSRIRTVDIRRELGLTDPPSDQELRRLLERKDWFQEAARSRAAMELQQVARELDRCDAERMSLLRDAAQIEARFVKCNIRPEMKVEMARLGKEARRLAQQMDEIIRCLRRGICRGLLYEVPDPNPADPAISAARRTLRERYERLTGIEASAFMEVMNKLAAKCVQHERL